MLGRGPPDPAEIAETGVGEDQPRPGVALAEPERVAAKGGDPTPGVDEDRPLALVGQGEHLLQAGMVEGESLRARVELDPGGAGVEAALGLGGGLLLRIDATEGGQAAL